MTINSRQFTQLSEMGISLWQSRASNNSSDTKNQLDKSQSTLVDIDLAQLTTTALFNDILLALNLSVGEVTAQAQHLDLGLFNWQFRGVSAGSDADSITDISYQQNTLTTPDLATLASSVKLKRQLWQTINQQLI